MPSFARRWLVPLLLVGSGLGPATVVAEQARLPWASSEPLLPQAQKASVAPETRLLPAGDAVTLLTLPALTAEEQADIAVGSGAKRHRIGIGRSLTLAQSRILATSPWELTADGRYVSQWMLQSPGAVGLRACIDVNSLPQGTQLRFFTPPSPQTVIATWRLGEDGAKWRGLECRWTPGVRGDTVGVELALPQGVAPDAMAYSVTQISHWYEDPLQSPHKRTVDIGAAGTCHNDIRCFESQWGNTADSVAKYTFIGSGGSTFLCTGTLLADLQGGTQVPYFLTAGHCIEAAADASTMELYWFFERFSCADTTNPRGVVSQAGGATLLGRDTTLDYALVRLLSTPPLGAMFSGWDTVPAQGGTNVVGIHHPGGDLKKISFGSVNGLSNEGEAVTGSGTHINMDWSLGVTEQGSSGSGLWKSEGDDQLLIGTLSSGFSSCANLGGADWYARFDRIFAEVGNFLQPGDPADQPDGDVALLNIATRGFVGSGDQQMIVGFVINGNSGTRRLLVTTRGPSLANDGLSGVLADPQVTVFRSSDGALLAVNDDWQQDASAAELQASGFAPASTLESALTVELGPGQYTANITGVGGGTGIGLLGVTDLGPVVAGDAELINLSTRGFVGSGDQQLIAGIVLTGEGERSFVSTAQGPVLSGAGVSGALADPVLTLVKVANGNLQEDANDDWRTHPLANQTQSIGLAPQANLESAMFTRLGPGSYTANMTGFNNSTGQGLVGVILLPKVN